MAAKNDVTGYRIASKANSQAYRDSYEAIFGKKKRKVDPDSQEVRDAVNDWGKRMLEAGEGFEHSGAYTGEQGSMRPLKG